MSKHRHITGMAVGVASILLLALGTAGCNQILPAQWLPLGSEPSQAEQTRPQSQRQNRGAVLRIVPRQNNDVADLKPDDVINVMEQVGFSESQILALGPELHSALANSGSAAVQYGDQTEVLYAVTGTHLFIQSRSQGRTYVYDLTHGQFGGTSSSPGMPR